MNIAQMQMMIALAECGSMTATAKSLNVTQPALTYQLKNIESELGFKVFDRSRTGTLLTREGAHLIGELKKIVGLYEHAVDASRAMASEPASVLKRLADAVQRGDAEGAQLAVGTLQDAGVAHGDILQSGVYAGVKAATGQFAHGDIYTPEMLAVVAAADCCLAAANAQARGAGEAARAAIGTVQGDKHTIGKDLVRFALEGAGVPTADLGHGCAPEGFASYVAQNAACRLVLVSVSNPNALEQVDRVVECLDAAGLRSRVALMVGGGAASPQFARSIGADAFTADADDAARKALELLGNE